MPLKRVLKPKPATKMQSFLQTLHLFSKKITFFLKIKWATEKSPIFLFLKVC